MIIAIPLRHCVNSYYVNESYLHKFKPLFINQYNLDMLELCDGILLPGGYDLASAWYHNDIDCNQVDLTNDFLDFYLIHYAINHHLPLLGICRGIQSINVYFGGSLQNIQGHQEKKHKIFVNSQIYEVNSYHHQAIKKIGTNLIALGWSQDNIIEIVRHSNYDILGLQFHPEKLDSKYIYNYFNSKLLHSVSLRYFENDDSI